jgi:GNAT superfamily N-acetyltransferase
VAANIRPARDDDLPLLAAVEVAAGELFRTVGMPDVADDEPPSVEELATAEALWVAVDEEDRPVGYVRVDVIDGHAHAEQLSVIPEHGRQGIGTALLEVAAQWARLRGDTEITLTTFRDVPFNAPIYARRGYEVVPEADWGPELQGLVAEEAAHDLDPDLRVVMRRQLG